MMKTLSKLIPLKGKTVVSLSLLIVGLMATTATAQVRRTLDQLDPDEQEELADLIIEYLDENVIGTHNAAMQQPFGALPAGQRVHMNENFLPFHRAYLAGLEDWLVLQGYDKYVPLPKWEPEQSIPADFQQIDYNACGNAWQNPSFPGNYCVQLTNTSTNINRQRPSQFTAPNLYTNTAIQILGQGLNLNWNNNTVSEVESPWHGFVHGDVGGVMGNGKSPSAAIFWPWHAYVDDVWKEWDCISSNGGGQTVDLWMRDAPMKLANITTEMLPMGMDQGLEPNTQNTLFYKSTDIWVRRQPDGDTTDVHQNPVYNSGNPAPMHVYVRVRNRGCNPSSGVGDLNLYWAKAGTNLGWPDVFNGNVFGGANNDIPMGGYISTENIPVIPAGGSAIVHFTWYPEDPAIFNEISNSPWHSCLLAVIDAPQDNDSYVHPVPEAYFISYNNNVVLKNLSVVRVAQESSTLVHIGNLGQNNPGIFDFELKTLPYEGGEIWNEAEVVATLDPITWGKWLAGGQHADNIRIFDESKHQLLVTSNNARIGNIHFGANEWGTLELSFNFLTEEVSGRKEFTYHLMQRDVQDQRIVGGEMYQIIRDPERQSFLAKTQSTTNPQTENTQLSATSIGEPAVYNWYKNDSLVHTGIGMSVSPATDQEYKLEVIADADGHKDYDTVIVEGTGNDIESMTPNPASSSVVVTYDVDQAASASLKVTSISGTPIGTYSLDLTINQETIDVSNYPVGLCIVTLTVDGENTDSKNLLIE